MVTNKKLKIISDIHGNIKKYQFLVDSCDYSVQLGDLSEGHFHFLDNIDPKRHKVLAGNHDNYSSIVNYDHYLGDFGIHNFEGFEPFGFVRGAFSIDHRTRLIGVDFWEEEEITYAQCEKVLEFFTANPVNIMLSHDCPLFLLPIMSKPGIAARFGYKDNPYVKSRTNQLLQDLLGILRPKLWIFGHHHKTLDHEVDGTKFVCMKIYGHMSFTPETFR